MEIDPLLSLLVGALGASLIGLLGAWIQARRDHRKWLREKRFDAYRAFLVSMSTYEELAKIEPTPQNAESTLKRLRDLIENLSNSFETVSLLGPRKVNAVGQNWVNAATALTKDKTDLSHEAFRSARWQFLVVSGKVLKSENVTKERPTNA